MSSVNNSLNHKLKDLTVEHKKNRYTAVLFILFGKGHYILEKSFCTLVSVLICVLAEDVGTKNTYDSVLGNDLKRVYIRIDRKVAKSYTVSVGNNACGKAFAEYLGKRQNSVVSSEAFKKILAYKKHCRLSALEIRGIFLVSVDVIGLVDHGDVMPPAVCLGFGLGVVSLIQLLLGIYGVCQHVKILFAVAVCVIGQKLPQSRAYIPALQGRNGFGNGNHYRSVRVGLTDHLHDANDDNYRKKRDDYNLPLMIIPKIIKLCEKRAVGRQPDLSAIKRSTTGT